VAVAVSATHIYWTISETLGSIMACTLKGCVTPTTVAGSQAAPYGVVVDSADVYWTDYDSDGGAVMKCPLAGCGAGPTVLAGGQNGPHRIVLDETNVYWTDTPGGAVKACAKAGCKAPIVIASGQNGPYGLAVDDSCVYWTDNSGGTVMKTAKP
jgi:hypothetical protein